MRIKNIFLLILLLLISTLDANINVSRTKPKIFIVNDQGWINLNPFNQPPDNVLYGVDFIDSQHGWAVGEWGLVLNSINGGQSWQILQNHTIDFHLKAVDFINENDGWGQAVG